MATFPPPSSGMPRSAHTTVAPIAAELDRDSLVKPAVPSIPDFLRPLTVGAFAPYRTFTVPLVAGQRLVIVQGNPLRVGLVMTVARGSNVQVDITTADAEDGHAIWHMSDGETRSAMLADYFSVIMATLVAVASVDTVMSLVEYVRPR